MSERATWNLDDGRVIELLRPEELTGQPIGSQLLSITGKSVTVGSDPIDGDVRAGYLAFGRIIVDKSYEERITTLAEKLVEAAPPLIVRALSDDGEGAMAVAMHHLIDAVAQSTPPSNPGSPRA